jgi:ribonuclease HI
MNSVQLWSDGSCCTKTKVGSYAFVLVNNEDELVDEGAYAEQNTTNNRMELTGVIEGLKQLRLFPNLPIEVYSDSAYVVNCFLDKWYINWRRSNWISSSGKEVKNRDLWEELLSLVEDRGAPVQWNHVKGHSGVHWNELCDALATQAREEAMK